MIDNWWSDYVHQGRVLPTAGNRGVCHLERKVDDIIVQLIVDIVAADPSTAGR